MGCACKNKSKAVTSDDITIEPVTTAAAATKVLNPSNNGQDITIEPVEAKSVSSVQKPASKPAPVGSRDSSVHDAREIDLEQCYLCAKKHVERAKDFFEEYHTKYPDHIKNLIQSIRVAEQDVMRAFLLWQRVMGQMNMGEGELLGNDLNRLVMRGEHIALANKIRNERIKLSDDPLYSPDFDSLLIDIHILQFKVLDNG